MNEKRKPYPHDRIEPKWQQTWAERRTFRTPNPGDADFDPAKPKFYVLDMFPYPSGSGLHVGHPEGYTATDIIARYRRMRGYNVLHPMGWDAFGLPAEQHAIKTGEHPRVNTAQNIENFKRQLNSLGFNYDWSREVNTTDPQYFRWTQWIFRLLYNSYYDYELRKAQPIELLIDALSEVPQRREEWKDNAYLLGTHNANAGDPLESRERFIARSRLAFVSEAPVNWCQALGTVLANEEVVDGKSEVGGFPVERRPMRQWMLRITAYAERLIDELDGLNWPEGIKLLQKNWIGRSEGAHVHFVLENFENTPRSLVALALDTDKADHPAQDAVPEGHRVHQTALLTVFTTRPDTLFGATYMVLSPEHPLVDIFAADEHKEAIARYRAEIGGKSDLERTELSKEKTGVFTGAYAVNPVNGERIPVWIADYVLMGYGTGAIMAVPAHDERDFEFARKFDLPIRYVVKKATLTGPDIVEAVTEKLTGEYTCHPGEGAAINSQNGDVSLDGLPSAEAKRKIIDWLEANGSGERRINYKLRDWLFSRQRYWGEPFPIIWQDGKHSSLPENELPLLPPDLDDFKPTGTGEPPLAKATDWVRYSDAATRETNTMPQWAGSCWYYLRFCDPRNPARFVGTEAERYWMGGRTPTTGGAPALQPEGKPGGVDLYVGGTEHAVLHLLYARFWHKVLFDHGYVSTVEPFQRLVNQGLILGEMQYTAFRRENGEYVSVKDVLNLDEEATESGRRIVGYTKVSPGGSAEKVTGESVGEEAVNKGPQGFQLTAQPGIYVDARSFKMSKSRGNVINPDAVVAEYGADALRLYEMFMGPLEQTKPWSMAGVQGVARFLARVWRLVMEENQEGQWTLGDAVQDVALTSAQQRVVHATIKKVTEDIEALSFNTAISQMMVCTNELTAATVRPVSALRALLQVLNPFAPHLTEELNETLDAKFPGAESGLLAGRKWPEYDAACLVEDEIEIPIQINGKLRERIMVKKDATAAEIESIALASPKVQEHLAGKVPRKVIVVPGKLVNVVA